jgi:GntR family transcriptional regulator
MANTIQKHAQILYPQVEATLREMIEDVEYGPGDKIPPERELSEMLGVSRMTVRRAIENLVKQGMLERHSTTGTFVRQPQVIRRLHQEYNKGLSQELSEEGIEPGSQLITFKKIRAPRKIAGYLNLRIGQFVVSLCRLRLADEQPFCVETAYLPVDLVPDLTADDFNKEISLYKILRERYDIIVASSEGTLKLSHTTPDEARLLRLEVGAPVLFRSAVSFDKSGNPIEYSKSVNHPEAVVFHTTRKA